MSNDTNFVVQSAICQLFFFLGKFLPILLTLIKVTVTSKLTTTWNQLVYFLYGVVTKSQLLNTLCKNSPFLEDKLIYLYIDKLPKVSTLIDANINPSSEVFTSIYYELYRNYSESFDLRGCGYFEEDLALDLGYVFDSSDFNLFEGKSKGAGHNVKNQGGLKGHNLGPETDFLPSLLYLTEADFNDKFFLSQLVNQTGDIYVFDKVYFSYQIWPERTGRDVFYVTRLNKNIWYTVLSGHPNHIIEIAGGGIVFNQVTSLKYFQVGLKARLFSFKDPESNKEIKFVYSMFGYSATSIIQLYKYRWNIEILFKRLRDNYKLVYFYSDSQKGSKNQIWIALKATLLFSVIHKQYKNSEIFTPFESLATVYMDSYISLLRTVNSGRVGNTNHVIKNI